MKLLLLLVLGLWITSCVSNQGISSHRYLKTGTYEIIVQTDTARYSGFIELTMAKDSALVGRVKMDINQYAHRPTGPIEQTADSATIEMLGYKLKVAIQDSITGALIDDTLAHSAAMLYHGPQVSEELKESLGYLPIQMADGSYLKGRWPSPLDEASFYYVAYVEGDWREKQIRKVVETDSGWSEMDIQYDNELYNFHAISLHPNHEYIIAHGTTKVDQEDPRWEDGLFKLLMKNENEVDSVIFLPPPVNVDDGIEIFPYVTRDGSIYFAANNRQEVIGGMDLYKATPKEEGYEVKRLDATVNSELSEAAPYVDDDSRFMLFYRRTESGEFPSTDKIFLSANEDGAWQEPIKLGAPVNTSYAFEYGARVSPNDQYLWLTSHRRESGHIYRIPIEDIPELKTYFP